MKFCGMRPPTISLMKAKPAPFSGLQADAHMAVLTAAARLLDVLAFLLDFAVQVSR
jgi:hypothetical protein